MIHSLKNQSKPMGRRPMRTRTKSSANVGGLGLLLDRVTASLVKEFEEAIAPWGLRNLHLGILSTVDRFGPMSQARIGEYLGIERQTMANLVNDLEQTGLIERRDVPEDRRVWAVAITAQGLKVRDEAIATGAQRERAIFGHLDADEQATLRALLVKLAPGGRYPHLFADPTES
jgi:DNA-binding MarR family transcriptional regulator